MCLTGTGLEAVEQGRLRGKVHGSMARWAPTLLLAACFMIIATPSTAVVYQHPSHVPGSSVNEQGYRQIEAKGKTWFIFQDKESETAYFFIPGGDISQWEDPRSRWLAWGMRHAHPSRMHACHCQWAHPARCCVPSSEGAPLLPPPRIPSLGSLFKQEAHRHLPALVVDRRGRD